LNPAWNVRFVGNYKRLIATTWVFAKTQTWKTQISERTTPRKCYLLQTACQHCDLWISRYRRNITYCDKQQTTTKCNSKQLNLMRNMTSFVGNNLKIIWSAPTIWYFLEYNPIVRRQPKNIVCFHWKFNTERTFAQEQYLNASKRTKYLFCQNKKIFLCFFYSNICRSLAKYFNYQIFFIGQTPTTSHVEVLLQDVLIIKWFPIRFICRSSSHETERMLLDSLMWISIFYGYLIPAIRKASLVKCAVNMLENTWRLYLFLEHQYQPVSSFLLTAAILV